MADNYDDVSAAVHALHAATEALEAAKQAFDESLLGVYDALGPLAVDPAEPVHDPRFIALIRHLYWNEQQVPPRDLAAVCGFSYLAQMLEAIGPVPSGVACTTCGRDIPRTSRTWKPNQVHTHTGPRPVCRSCDKAATRARDNNGQLWGARSRYVERAGAGAPAWEWRLACAIVRAYPPVSTRIEPGTEADRQTGTWLEFDSSLYVERVVGADRDRDSQVSVRMDAAMTLVASALNAAAWDSARVCEIGAPFTEESPTYALSRLEDRIKTARELAEAKACEVYPDGRDVPYDREWDSGWRDTVRRMPEPF